MDVHAPTLDDRAETPVSIQERTSGDGHAAPWDVLSGWAPVFDVPAQLEKLADRTRVAAEKAQSKAEEARRAANEASAHLIELRTKP